MKSLKILVPYPSSFDEVSNTSILFRKLLPVLQERATVTIMWLNYQPSKLFDLPKADSFITLDIHNYKNAVELVKKEKPDLIFAPPHEGFIDMSFSFSGKILNIPVFTLAYYQLSSGTLDKIPTSSLLKSYLKRMSNDTVPSETHQYKKSKFRRGNFILFKFLFFLKTLFACKFNFLKMLSILSMVFKFYISPPTKIDSRLAVDMHFTQNESIKNEFIKSNIPISKIKVTGHPMFDDLLLEENKLKDNKKSKTSSNKVRILLAPLSFYEYGDWTKDQRDYVLKEIVKEIIKEKDSFSLTVKIHPTAALLDDYEKIIHSIDPNIKVFQNGNIEDFLYDTDVFISYYSWSTASMYALFHGVPIVICNFFGKLDDEMINRKLSLECKDPSKLNKIIHQISSNNPATKEKVDDYVTRFFYKSDGKSAKRIADSLFQLIEKNHN